MAHGFFHGPKKQHPSYTAGKVDVARPTEHHIQRLAREAEERTAEKLLHHTAKVAAATPAVPPTTPVTPFLQREKVVNTFGNDAEPRSHRSVRNPSFRP